MPNSSRFHPSKRYPAPMRKGRVHRKRRRGKKRRRKARQPEVQYTSRTLTAYGFFSPMAMFLLEVLHLKEAFASQISLAHQGKEFPVPDFCITLVLLPILEQTLDPRELRILDVDGSTRSTDREEAGEGQAGQEHQGQGERLLLVERGGVLWLYPSPDPRQR